MYLYEMGSLCLYKMAISLQNGFLKWLGMSPLGCFKGSQGVFLVVFNGKELWQGFAISTCFLCDPWSVWD